MTDKLKQPPRRKVYAIMAVNQQNVLGINNTIPWRSREDMRHFADTTRGSIVIMGRKTYESLNGRTLQNRAAIVLTRSGVSFNESGIRHSVKSLNLPLQAAIEYGLQMPCPSFVDPKAPIFVIGGGEIYKQALPLIDGFILSRIETPATYDLSDPNVTILDDGYTKVHRRIRRIDQFVDADPRLTVYHTDMELADPNAMEFGVLLDVT